MDDDDFGFGGGDDDNPPPDDGQGDSGDDDDTGQADDDENGGGGDNDDQPRDDDGAGFGDLDQQFASPDDLVDVDNDVYSDVADFDNAVEEDFYDDDGGWSADDYLGSAERIFGGHEFFGDTLATQLGTSGFEQYRNDNFTRQFDEIAPGTSETLHLFERDGRLWAFGFVPLAVLELLQARYTGIDLSNVEVATPFFGKRVEPQPLPPAYAQLQPAPAVDLRKFATPVGDQRQTARCAAFAWTHALELTRNVKSGYIPQAAAMRLSPNYTMLQFQRMQGDARDYTYAYKGGDGTVGGVDPGEVLAQNGTCRQDFWPDDSPRPMAGEQTLAADAQQHRLDGVPLPIALDDVKTVLTAGCPVQVSINTGPQFSDVGRDGMVRVAEAASGMHGRHAMLITGYTGNFYIVKNSWGTDWGDQGYCYIPKAVLADSDPEFVAVLLRRS